MLKKLFIVCALCFIAPSTQGQVTEAQTPIEIEKTVREYFAVTPVMIEIARCESKFRQFTDAGNVFRGGYDNNMVGVFQFYESVHQQAADDLGYDIATLQGNLDYATYVYGVSGTTPWNSAYDCWHDATSTPSYDTSVATASVVLSNAELREKIVLLQQILQLLQTLLALQTSHS